MPVHARRYHRIALPSRHLAAACAALVLAIAAVPSATAQPAPQAASAQEAQQRQWRTQLQTFAGSLTDDAELPAQWVAQVLGQAQYNPRVKRLMTPAPGTTTTVRDWQAYRARLLTSARIESGVMFWRRHQRTLQDAELRWGVPASVIVGIIGIESAYGQNTGNIRVLDALATLAFDYPAEHPRAQERADYFRRELVQFLRMARSNGLDPLQLRGSYAGAMGIPQFMPSSWLLYGQDFDGDGRVNLIDSPEDAIGSVANYLAAHGWRAGQPAYFDVALQASAEQKATLLAPSILPTFDQPGLQALGAQLLPAGQRYDGQMALIELRNGAQPAEYVIGTENFYAVTRYNQSSYYALAVLQLGEAVQHRLQQQAAAVTPPADF